MNGRSSFTCLYLFNISFPVLILSLYKVFLMISSFADSNTIKEDSSNGTVPFIWYLYAKSVSYSTFSLVKDNLLFPIKQDLIFVLITS